MIIQNSPRRVNSPPPTLPPENEYSNVAIWTRNGMPSWCEFEQWPRGDKVAHHPTPVATLFFRPYPMIRAHTRWGSHWCEIYRNCYDFAGKQSGKMINFLGGSFSVLETSHLSIYFTRNWFHIARGGCCFSKYQSSDKIECFECSNYFIIRMMQIVLLRKSVEEFFS